jgi:hypothetical protein
MDVYNSNIWRIATWDFIDGWDKFNTIGYYNIDFDKTEDETLTANDIIKIYIVISYGIKFIPAVYKIPCCYSPNVRIVNIHTVRIMCI